jgi:hypothetical protein
MAQPTDMNKQQIIDTLSRVRSTWRRLSEAHRPGFELAFHIMALELERSLPEDETWTHHPDESELNARSRVGDHLAVTRRLLRDGRPHASEYAGPEPSPLPLLAEQVQQGVARHHTNHSPA